jgi:hypothetical protein
VLRCILPVFMVFIPAVCNSVHLTKSRSFHAERGWSWSKVSSSTSGLNSKQQSHSPRIIWSTWITEKFQYHCKPTNFTWLLRRLRSLIAKGTTIFNGSTECRDIFLLIYLSQTNKSAKITNGENSLTEIPPTINKDKEPSTKNCRGGNI